MQVYNVDRSQLVDISIHFGHPVEMSREDLETGFFRWWRMVLLSKSFIAFRVDVCVRKVLKESSVFREGLECIRGISMYVTAPGRPFLF